MINIDFIRKTTYSKWMSNPVIVKMYDGKIRVYIDFSNVAKLMQRIVRIDQLLYSIVGHKLLSFIDACLGYSQISKNLAEQIESCTIIRLCHLE